MEGDVSCVIIF